MFLNELKNSIGELKGVGPAAQKAYANLGVFSFADLLSHTPRDYEDRKHVSPLSTAAQKGAAYVIVTVASHEYFGSYKNRTLKVLVYDDSASAALLCFGRNFLSRKLQIGMRFHLFGHFSYHYGQLQCSLFETEPYQEGVTAKLFDAILPVYPLSSGLTQNTIRRDVKNVLRQVGPYIEEQLPESIIKTRKLMKEYQALHMIHFPPELEMVGQARSSLAFAELFYLELTLLKRARKRREERVITGTKKRDLPLKLRDKLIQNLPFALTEDQKKSLEQIENDLRKPYSMNRLLQGDVGSGKTLTGFISMLPIIESGGQAAFMAPTELLAKQHAENAALYLEPLGVKVAFLTGSVTGAARKNLLEALRTGEIHLAVGTHALFSDDVVFRDLQYVIVDEQQRFGVSQRISLSLKGRQPHQLLMTATPIPRTMALTVFGDLDISTIRTMPPGRKPVITHLASQKRRHQVYQAVEVEFSRKHQAYFVYPRIDAAGNSDLRDVESMFSYLSQELYPSYRGALIHSRLGEDEKIRVMHQFKQRKLDFLVSTSVVEVGVDIPNATCMVIEHAERFGLSALHQLRGRVGRGEHQSYAFLIYSENLQEDGKRRLKVMKSTEDGFKIAEEDLLIRGPGEIAGRRQSGYLSLRFADIVEDFELMKLARLDASDILEADAALSAPDHQMIAAVLNRCNPFDDSLIE
jgi:ATP-dependent DNA helicase RecG